MTPHLFAPRARRELREAAAWIAGENPAAAEALLRATLRAAELVAAKPGLARVRLDLAPARFRFWSLRGYPYLLVFDVDRTPPVVARFVHQARDLPVLLSDLGPDAPLLALLEFPLDITRHIRLGYRRKRADHANRSAGRMRGCSVRKTTICCVAWKATRRWGRSCAGTGCRPACPKRSRSATAPPSACACSARTSSHSATATAGSAWSARCARTAAPRSPWVATRNAACAACITAGRSDVAGNILEMPSEPADSRFREKLKHKAYPVHEAAGLVWVFMGPAAEMPAFDPPVFQPTPDTKISIARIIVDCNWAQVLEGAIDSAHSSTLHASDMVPAQVAASTATGETWLRPSTDKAPTLHVQRTPFGFRYAAIRRPIVNETTHMYVRTTLFIAPFTVHIPGNNLHQMAIQQVPMDDTHTAFHFIAFGAETTPDTDTWRKYLGAEVGVDVDRRWRKTRTRDNDFLQDRAGDAGRQFHRHSRHPEPGHRDVGDHGAHRRPLAGAAGRQRYRDPAVPPHHGRGGAQLPGRRPGDRPRRARIFRTRTCARSRAWCARPRTGARSAWHRKNAPCVPIGQAAE